VSASFPTRPERAEGERRSEAPAEGKEGRTLTLASRSPQRRAILAQLGIAFTVARPDVEERGEGDPRELVTENARRKAEAVDGRYVLGADTTVALDGSPYGKPRDAREAEAVLWALSGCDHEVWSGIVLREEGDTRLGAARTRVRFRALSQSEIEWYVESGEWRERAGGYAIQGRGAALVEKIEGDFWNVVGLPVAELLRIAPGLLPVASQSRPST
jgi:nucleoside triphosphate pyrophosphatase